MKKLLSLVLVLSLVLGSFGMAFAAPADVAGTDYEDAVARLSALEILTGYEDGSFKPGNTITRAEFATVVVRTLGLDAAAKLSASTQFSDVSASHWASGYISVAAGLGVINGYPDGSFKPSAPVKYEEALTMIVRALGYEPAVTGGYPLGYIAKAAELEITEDVAGTVGAPASRGVVALLVDNSLEVDLMERSTYGDTAEYTANPLKNLLVTKIGATVYEEWTVSAVDLKNNEITIKEGTKTEEFKVVDGIGIKGLEDAVVTVWKYNKKIVYIDVVSDIVFDWVVSFNTTADTAKLKILDDTFDYTVADGDLATGYARLVMDGDEIIAIDSYNVNLRGFVTEVKADDEYILYNDYNGDSRKVRFDEDDVMVVIDGVVESMSDLDEGMLLFSTSDAKVLVATTKTVEGEFERSKADEITVDGTDFDAVGTGSRYYSTDGGEEFKLADSDKLDSLLGEEVIVYFDYKDDVLMIAGEVDEETSDFYALVINAATSGFDNVVKVMNADEDVVNYYVDLDKDESTIKAFGDIKAGNIYMFTVDEDNIIIEATEKTDLADTAQNGTPVTSVDEDDDLLEVGAGNFYEVNDSTIFYNIEDFYNTTTKAVTNNGDDVEVIKWSAIEKADSVSSLRVRVVATTKGVAKAVVIFAGSDNILSDDLYTGIITDKAKINKDYYYLTVDTGLETIDVKVKATVVGTVYKEDILAYQLTSEGNGTNLLTNAGISANTELTYRGTTAITNIDGRYITTGAGTFKLAADASIYEIKATADKKRDLGDLNIGDTMEYVVRKGQIVAIKYTAN